MKSRSASPHSFPGFQNPTRGHGVLPLASSPPRSNPDVRFILLLLVCALAFGLSHPAFAQDPSGECRPGLGGTVFGAGRNVEVEILEGNPSAIYVSDLYLQRDTKNIHFGNSRQAGRIVRLGRIPAGEELFFYIVVQQTGNVFFSGDPSRNPGGGTQATVECGSAGAAVIGFEDSPERESDRSYNDLRFRVTFSPVCGRGDQSRAIVDEISGFTDCGNEPGLLGPKNAEWGKFGSKEVLESDAGEKLEIRCEPGDIPSYVLYYTSPTGARKSVGRCPFKGGCNTQYFKHSGDANDDGRPDCFLQTVWRSRDYGADDDEPSNGILEHALFTFSVLSGNLTRQTPRYIYRIPPPITQCRTGQERPEGRQLPTITNSIGPAPEAISGRLVTPLLLAEDAELMHADPVSVADLNRDGLLDDTDRAIFDDALGKCEGDSEYNSFADLDPDGCVTLSDEEFFLDLLNARTGNEAPVANCKDVVTAASATCTAAIAAEDVNSNSFDPDGSEITLSLAPSGPLGLGQHEVTLTATDSGGLSGSCQATVSVIDRTAPSIASASVNKPVLWPPNHKMVDVEVRYDTLGDCSAVTALLSVSSSEPTDHGGDGHSSSDWEVVDTHHVRLRAERSGQGTGRIYTITITAEDGFGNALTQDLHVTVPHNQ